jgi:cardiolipin synthase
MFFHISLFTYIIYGFGVLLSVIALIVVPRNRKPTAGMAWLMIIFLVPIVGWILFLLLGTNKLPAKRRNSQDAIDLIIDKRVVELGNDMNNAVPKKYASVAKLVTSLGHLPPLPGYVSEYMTDYEASIDSIVSDLNNAHDGIYLEYFILTLDGTTRPVFDALVAAKERGVEVRVLFDWWGSRKYKTYKSMLQFLNENDISFQSMLPLQFSVKNYLRFDLRNHRKLVVIDQQIGYVGSQNLIRRNYGRKDDIVYDELVARMTGPIVQELSTLFVYDWSVETDEPLSYTLNDELLEAPESHASLLQILPSGPSYNDENNLKVFTLAVSRAEREIFIANPYFVPAEPLLSAIVSAAKRGVRVRMINSQAMDQWMVGHAQRSYYEELLLAGVEVYLYKKPILLHSKFILIDDELGIVGSSNLDIRSFELDQEISLIIYGEKEAQRLQIVRDDYLARSYPIRIEKWRRRKLYSQLLDSVARLTSNVQ